MRIPGLGAALDAVGMWKHVHWHLAGTKPDMLVVSSPRSGSTWMSEILSAVPGLNVEDDVLSPNKKLARPYGDASCLRDRYISLDPAQQTFLLGYLEEIRTDAIRLGGYRRLLEKNHSLVVRRKAIKTVRASNQVLWLAQHTAYRITYMTRHPVANALSRMAKNWDHYLGTYLADESFCEAWLSEAQQAHLVAVRDQGTKLQHFFATWCLENRQAIAALQQGNAPFCFVSYEDMVTDYAGTIQRIADYNDLPLASLQTVDRTRPSRQAQSRSDSKVLAAIEQHDTDKLIYGWKNRVEATELQALQAILDVLEIDLYSTTQPAVAEKYRISGT